MRPPKPDFVIEWERSKPAPRCCHTCENYTPDGICYIHKESPPDEFVNSVDVCDFWMEEIPF